MAAATSGIASVAASIITMAVITPGMLEGPRRSPPPAPLAGPVQRLAPSLRGVRGTRSSGGSGTVDRGNPPAADHPLRAGAGAELAAVGERVAQGPPGLHPGEE